MYRSSARNPSGVLALSLVFLVRPNTAALSCQRTYPLQFTLHNLNDRQGLGFRVFSKVIDKKT